MPRKVRILKIAHSFPELYEDRELFCQDSTTKRKKVKYCTCKHLTLYNQSLSEGYIDIYYYVALLFDVVM